MGAFKWDINAGINGGHVVCDHKFTLCGCINELIFLCMATDELPMDQS